MKLPILSLLLALTLLLAACGPSQAQRDTQEPMAPAGEAPQAQTPAPLQAQEPDESDDDSATARQVRAIAAEEGALRASRSTSVTIEPQRQARIASGASGRVVEILKREGAIVEEGETVVRLDDAAPRSQVRNAELALETARINLRSAERGTQEGAARLEAQLRAAEANLELARRQLEEGRALYEAGGIAQAELSSLEAQVSQSEASFFQAREAFSRSGRADEEDVALLRVQVRQAELGLEEALDALTDAEVRASFSGEIAELLVEEGEFLSAGSPVLEIVGLERQQARFRVPPEDAAGLQNEDLLWIRYGGLDYASRVLRSSPVPGQQRLVEMVAEVYESQNPIPPGSVAELRYEVELALGIVLPSGAISTEAGQNYVFIAEDGIALRQPVSVLAEAGGQAVVDGVDAGALIIYPRPLDVREGVRVRVIEE
jgi:HlyD family secretion protein